MRGSIVKRSKESWAVVVSLGNDPVTGRRRQKWYSHKTRREAELHLAQLLSSIQNGTWTPPTKELFSDYLQHWLRDYATSKVRPTTFASYEMIIRRHVAPVLGHVPLTMLTPRAIQGYFTRKLQGVENDQGKWIERPLSSTTVRHHAMLLHKALQTAVRQGVLVQNPADRVDPPRNSDVKPQVLDEEQTRMFLGEARRSSPYYCFYLAAVTTGMRAGELMGLRWQDVDLITAIASVQQTFYRLGRRQLFGKPKSEKSRRVVVLPPVLVEELRRLHEEQAETRRQLGAVYENLGLVFCQPNGRPLHLNNIRGGDFRRVLKRAGLSRITIHCLRHSHATHLLRSNVHPKIVQERLGHSTPAFTLQIYSHVLPGMQEQAVADLQARLFGGKPAVR